MTDKSYQECRLCGRACRKDRSVSEGFCREGDALRVGYIGLHNGEEPCLTGKNGSGTVFFTGCSLQCAYCQNYQLSRSLSGCEMSSHELASRFLKLQEKGAANINLVTAGHFIPTVIEALEDARERGLFLPVVFNGSAFEAPEALEALLPYVDVFLPDFKTLSSEFSRDFFHTSHYPLTAKESLEVMLRKGPPVFDGESLVQGVLVRHLVIPGFIEETFDVLDYLASVLKNRGLLSLMFQYTPIDIPGEESISDHDKIGSGVAHIEHHIILIVIAPDRITKDCQEGRCVWLDR